MLIPEAFLIAALALPSVGFTHGKRPIIDDKVSFERLLSNKSRFLAVGGDPVIVANLRNAHINAFGALTMDWPGITRWHIVADAGHIGFQTASFATILWRHSNPRRDPAYPELVDAARLAEPLGRLIFLEDDYPLWPHWLTQWCWKRLYVIETMVIYQKPFFGDSRIHRNLSDLERWQRNEKLISTSG